MHRTRLAAAQFAVANNWETFETFVLGNGLWVSRETRDNASELALVWLKKNATEKDNGVLHVGSLLRQPLVVLTRPPAELGYSFPSSFIVQPATEGLFEPLGPKANRWAPSMRERPVQTSTDTPEKGGSQAPVNPSPVAPNKGAVAITHAICDKLLAEGKFSRKAALVLCESEGVNKSTASTQIYRWKKKNNVD